MQKAPRQPSSEPVDEDEDKDKDKDKADERASLVELPESSVAAYLGR